MRFNNSILIYPCIILLLSSIVAGCSKTEVSTIESGPTVSDVDGNVYHSVKIGTQTWLVENLRTTKFRNGDLIKTKAASDAAAESKPNYQWDYAGNQSYLAAYGRLYSWYAATDTRNIAPAGWHVPNSREWMTLINFLGGPTIAGGQLKEKGTSLWIAPNTGATNMTGFTALPGGFFSWGLSQIGESANWWSVATPSYEPFDRADFFGVSNEDAGVTTWDYPMDSGLSVRCVMD